MSSKRSGLVIALDVDGVIRDFTGKCLEIYKRLIDPGADVSVDNWTKFYDVNKAMPKLPNEEFPLFMERHAKELFLESKLYDEDDLQVLDRLHKNHYLYIVTTQPKTNEGYTLGWLNNHMIPYHGLFFTRNKFMLKAHVALDDAIHNLLAYQTSGVKPVAMNRPWNQDWQGERVNSLSEFERMCERYAGR